TDEEEEPRGTAIERQLADLPYLRGFALPLIERLDALPQQASWGDWLTHLRALATAALREPDGVLATLAEIEPMAPIGPIDLDEVQLVLGPRLRELTVPPARRRYAAAFVPPARAARRRPGDHRRQRALPPRRERPPRTRAPRPRPALAPALDPGGRARRSGRARPRGARGSPARGAPLLADRPPALRRLSVPLLPAGGHAAPAARGAGGYRGARPAHAWRALPRGPVRRPERAARRGAPPGPAREPRRGARGGRWRARHGGHALGREALAGNRPGVEGRHRRHPCRPARVAAARGG